MEVCRLRCSSTQLDTLSWRKLLARGLENLFRAQKMGSVTARAHLQSWSNRNKCTLATSLWPEFAEPAECVCIGQAGTVFSGSESLTAMPPHIVV